MGRRAPVRGLCRGVDSTSAGLAAAWLAVVAALSCSSNPHGAAIAEVGSEAGADALPRGDDDGHGGSDAAAQAQDGAPDENLSDGTPADQTVASIDGTNTVAEADCVGCEVGEFFATLSPSAPSLPPSAQWSIVGTNSGHFQLVPIDAASLA